MKRTQNFLWYKKNLLEQLQGHLGGLPLMLAEALEVGKREYP